MIEKLKASEVDWLWPPIPDTGSDNIARFLALADEVINIPPQVASLDKCDGYYKTGDAGWWRRRGAAS